MKLLLRLSREPLLLSSFMLCLQMGNGVVEGCPCQGLRRCVLLADIRKGLDEGFHGRFELRKAVPEQ